MLLRDHGSDTLDSRDRIDYIHSIPVYNEDYWVDEVDWENSPKEAMSWFSPTAYYYAIAAPSQMNTAKASFQMGMSYGVFAGANYLTGSLAPYNPFYHTIQRAYGMAYNARALTRFGAHLGRGALFAGYRAIPVLGMLATAYFASKAYWRHLSELDWVPDLYQGPNVG